MGTKKTAGGASQAVSRKPLNATMRGLMLTGAGLLAIGGFAGISGFNDPEQNLAIADEQKDQEVEVATSEPEKTMSTTTVTSVVTSEPMPGEIDRSQSEPSEPDANGVATVTEEITVTKQADPPQTPEPVDQGNEPHSEQNDDSNSLSERDSAPSLAPECSYGRHAQLFPGQTHVVAPCETLVQISQRSGVPMWTIAKSNGIDNPDHIVAGTVITIPYAK